MVLLSLMKIKINAAYAMPDGSSAENRQRNNAIKEAEKELDLYYKTIAPYAAAQKLVHCFENRYEVIKWAESNYDKACEIIRQGKRKQAKMLMRKRNYQLGGASDDEKTINQVYRSCSCFFDYIVSIRLFT